MDEPDRSSPPSSSPPRLPPPYALPPEDEEYLKAFAVEHGSSWERKAEGPNNSKWGLFIENFPIPPGYDRGRSTLMLLIPTGYPGAALDMFYFYPPLARSDDQSIDALADEAHFKTDWQRWSRHYEWTPGEDSIVSHVEYVLNELKNETSS